MLFVLSCIIIQEIDQLFEDELFIENSIDDFPGTLKVPLYTITLPDLLPVVIPSN